MEIFKLIAAKTINLISQFAIKKPPIRSSITNFLAYFPGPFGGLFPRPGPEGLPGFLLGQFGLVASNI
jgi:hypothetical protein